MIDAGLHVGGVRDGLDAGEGLGSPLVIATVRTLVILGKACKIHVGADAGNVGRFAGATVTDV